MIIDAKRVEQLDDNVAAVTLSLSVDQWRSTARSVRCRESIAAQWLQGREPRGGLRRCRRIGSEAFHDGRASEPARTFWERCSFTLPLVFSSIVQLSQMILSGNWSFAVNRTAWNELAENFEDLVCDVASTETNDQLRRFVGATRPSPKTSVLVDLGCGIGSFIRRFGRRFREIVAVEYAPRTIARAQERCAAIEGIKWFAMDVARASKRIGPRADLTVCLNVITSASTATRNAQWCSVAAVTKPLGFALLVVPALESDEMMQAHSRRARSAKSAATADGLVDRDGSWQKHYRRDELVSVVSQHGLDVKRIGRVFSPWSGEGLDRPPSGNSKGPWDWICLAQRPLRAG